MDYIVKHKTDLTQEFDFVNSILETEGVTDIEAFLHVGAHNYLSPFLMKNMKEGIELLHTVLAMDNPQIFVLIDSDVDGYTSGTVMISFLREHYPNATVHYKLSPNKSHGLKSSYLTGYEHLDLIIIPDAGTNDLTAVKSAHKAGTAVLILDHHIKEEEIVIKTKKVQNNIEDYAVLINCTDGVYPNPTLTGVGVVVKFLEAYCKTYMGNKELAWKYLDLMALGMIADDADMRNLETRAYTLAGLAEGSAENEFLKELLLRDEESFLLGNTFTNFGWKVAPYINAMVRYGKTEEQEDTVRALLGEQEEREYQPRRKSRNDPIPPMEVHSLQKFMARVCHNCKSRQDNEVRRYVETLKQMIEDNGLNTHKVLVVDSTEVVQSTTVTGLIANKLASFYQKPVILLRTISDEVYGGSMRSFGRGALVNFKDILMGTNLCISVLGHQGAAGVQIEKNKVTELIEILDKTIDENDLVRSYEVDYEIKADRLTKESVQMVANSYALWSKHIPEPLFAITDLHINAQDIQGLSREGSDYVGTIKFTHGDVGYLKKYCQKADFENMTLKDRRIFGVNKKNLLMTLICSFNLSAFTDEAGKIVTYPRVVIKHFEVTEDKNAPTATVKQPVKTKVTPIVTDNPDDFVF